MRKLGINSVISSVGTFLNAVLGLIFYVLVARALGPAQFGIVSVAIAISVVASDIFDFGMNTSMIRFLSETEDENKIHLAKDFFSYKIVSILIIIVLGLGLSQFLASLFFKDVSLWILVWQGFLAGGALILYGYINSNLQARKRFISSVCLNLSSNGLRLIATIYFFTAGILDKNLTMLVYLVPIYLVAIIWGIVDGDISLRPKFTKNIFLPVINYGKWVAGSVAISSVSSRLDNFLLVNLASVFQTGIYTSVQRIFLAFNQIPAGISVVLAPDLSSGDSTKSSKALKFGFLTSGLISTGLIGFIIFAPFLVPLVFGTSFSLSVIPAQFLAFGAMFFVMTVPLNSFILYTKKKSNRTFAITIVQLIATIIFNLFLIPLYQAQGAAISYAGVSIIGFLVTLLLFLKN